MNQRDSLIETYRSQQEKYNYYIIAIAVACIGFSVNLTLKHKLVWLDVTLGVAIISWLTSVYCGLRVILFHLSAIYANIALIDVQKGVHEISGNHPEKIQIGIDTLKKVIEDQSNNVSKLGKIQRYCLYSGIIMFIIWRVIDMT
jgi:hypothetical protein